MSDAASIMNLSEVKRRADLQADQERLEKLAAIRAGLQKAFKDVTTKNHTASNNFFITPSTTSTMTFLCLDSSQSESILKSRLDESEAEIRDLCESVQGRLHK